MNEYIIYEQPVTENVRNFLKCEYLFEKFNSAIQKQDMWSVKSSISTLIEISDLIFRINLKVELLKELEKNILFLNYLYNDNSIEISVYDNFITKTKNCIVALNNINDSPSKSVLSNDFLMQIKSKLHIPAGENFFDMPSYLNFLSSNRSFIIDNINLWYLPFEPFFASSKLILDIKRKNSKFITMNSAGSYFEKKIDKNSKFDLARIKLIKNINIFPDISIRSQNINIIFKTSYGPNRLSKTISKNIDFELSLSCTK